MLDNMKQAGDLLALLPSLVTVLDAAKSNSLAIIPGLRDGKPVLLLAAFDRLGQEGNALQAMNYRPIAEMVVDPDQFSPAPDEKMLALVTMSDGVLAVAEGNGLKTASPRERELSDIIASFDKNDPESRRKATEALLRMVLRPNKKQLNGSQG